MASLASWIVAMAASSSPFLAASSTQCLRWSSSRPVATPCRARVCPSLLVLQDGAGAGSWGEVDATQQLGVERDDDGGDRHQDRTY